MFLSDEKGVLSWGRGSFSLKCLEIRERRSDVRAGIPSGDARGNYYNAETGMLSIGLQSVVILGNDAG